MSKKSTLFKRTVVTLGVSLFIYSVFSIFVINNYILHPMVEKGADDLAALMTLASRTWVELPPNTRPDFEHELLQNHGLQIIPTDVPSSPTPLTHPYYTHLYESLKWRAGDGTVLSHTIDNSQRWVWADIQTGGKKIRIGFNAQRIGQTSLAAFMVSAGGVFILIITTFTLVPRLTKPLEQLLIAVQRFTGNSEPVKIPEQSTREFADLANSFNQMQQNISDLVENRTTLLAGISHDLRTPLARMQLAIELIAKDDNKELIDGIHKDLEEMNHLIGQTLSLAKEMSNEQLLPIDLSDFIDGIVDKSRRSGLIINWVPAGNCICHTAPLGLERVLDNLLDNAWRYSSEKPITIQLSCDGGKTVIQICDQGPGIEVQQLNKVVRPFYRIENSRNRKTGGSGLGLAIVQQICKSHHWKLSLENATDGGLIASLTLSDELESTQSEE